MKKSKLRQLIKEEIKRMFSEDVFSSEGYLEIIDLPDGRVRLQVNTVKGSGLNKVTKQKLLKPAIEKSQMTKEYIKNVVSTVYSNFPESEIDSVLEKM